MLSTNVLAGEAGPEAVLPLNRGSNGELGVNANGMGTINVNFNITAVDAQGIDQLLIERKQFITNMIRSSVADRGKVLY
jgi:phage-related minor tail protein